MKLQRFGKGGKWSQGRIVGFALLGFVLVVAASTVMFSKSTSGANGHAAAVPTLAVQVSAPQATPTKAAPSPTSEPNRADCGQIRGTAYQSNTEQEWFRVNCAGATATTPSGSSSAPVVTTRPVPAPTAAPAPSYNGPTVAAGGSVSGDELMITRLGVDGRGCTRARWAATAPWATPTARTTSSGTISAASRASVRLPRAGRQRRVRRPRRLPSSLPGGVLVPARRGARRHDRLLHGLSAPHLQYTVDWNIDAAPDADFSSYVAQTGQRHHDRDHLRRRLQRRDRPLRPPQRRAGHQDLLGAPLLRVLRDQALIRFAGLAGKARVQRLTGLSYLL